MAAVFASKDIILAFFGLFLSIVFSQGLFPRIVAFAHEFSYSVIPFGFNFSLGSGEKMTKDKAAKLNGFQVERARKLSTLQKSILCNASVAMTILVVAITALSFKLVGIPIRNIEIAWGLLLTLGFVYFSYGIWSFAKDREYWNAMPAMSSSKFNILLSLEAVLLVIYSTLRAREIYNIWLFLLLGLLVIFFALRLHRIPHINTTHRPAVDFQEREDFYLKDIGRETLIVALIFICAALLNHFCFDFVVDSAVGRYVEAHPVRSFTTLICVPFVIFAVRFFRVVGRQAIWRFVFYVGRAELPDVAG